MEDKPTPGGSGEKTFSWWDIQDENARLPVKEAPQSEFVKLFAPHKPKTEYDVATKAAKGAFKSLGKAMNAVAGEVSDSGPPVPVIAFKLLDLMKMHDDFATKHGGKHGFSAPPAPTRSKARQPARAPAPAPPRQQPQQHAAPPRQQQQAARPQQQQQPPTRQPQQDASLLDFGAPAPATGGPRREMRHTTSSPAAFDQMHARAPAPPANETRAERLKREYTQKQSTTQRVWDDVDQRWVEVDPKISNSAHGSTASSNNGRPKAKERGLSMEASAAAAASKSASVQAAVSKRMSEMQQSQQKALGEIRKREEEKKKSDTEEDDVRKRLEPKIKAWSEEHGKKKQLRALVGTLQNILWAEANWKPIGLGDLLDDSKCKKAFHKASRVVHPDKTHHLDAEKRFLAKRIFDALSQAKKEFDDGAK